MYVAFIRTLVFALALFPALVTAQLAGGLMFPGPGTPAATSSYQGPGDIVSGATAWGSCARVYNAAAASTSTSLCDLVDSSAPTVVICTLRGTTSGFVDLAGAYCTGSVTPATKCAAATGGTCNISKVYDQTGNGNHWTNATASTQPKLSFSAINSLPALVGTSAANTALNNVNTLTIAQPITFTAIAKRTANFTTLQWFQGSSATSVGLAATTSANTWEATAGSALTKAATDSAFHFGLGVINGNGTSSIIAIDNAETAGAAGTTGLSANTMRILRGNGGGSCDCTLAEVGIWPSLVSSGNRTSMYNNATSAASGYNGAF
jgi:hypothetical protein